MEARRAEMFGAAVRIREVAGEPAPSSVLAPKVGPMGLSPKKIGDDIVKVRVLHDSKVRCAKDRCSEIEA